MQPDDIREELSNESEVRWDELRSRRVLATVGAERSARSRARRLRTIALTISVTVAAVFAFFQLRTKEQLPEAPIAIVSSAHPPSRPSMKLPDGSLAVLSEDAHVEIGVVQPSQLVIVQSSGEVRYEVTHDPSRVFMVQVGGVEVKVLGTVFTTTLTDRVGVHVDDGHVQVDDGQRVVILGPGDDLWIPVRQPTPKAPEPTATVTSSGSAPVRAAPSAPSLDVLLDSADRARAAGNLAEASKSLETLIATYPNDPRAVSAHFTLGRVYRQSGQHRDAATAFRHCWQQKPNGPLAEDARAEEAASWHDAGDEVQARAAATDYLARYPDGTYAKRMRQLNP